MSLRLQTVKVFAYCVFCLMTLCSLSAQAQGVDLQRHCRTHGSEGVTNLDGSGYGWRCMPGQVSISVDSVCKEQYGSEYIAQLKSPPPGAAGDWICVRAAGEAAGKPLDLDRFCTARGFSKSTNLDGTGYGWRCMPGNVSIVMGDVCRMEYGQRFQAILVTSPPGKAADWVCRDVTELLPTWTNFAAVRVVIPGDSSKASAQRIRLALANPPLPSVEKLKRCASMTSTQEDFFACTVENALPSEYRVTSTCIKQNPGDGGRAFACSTGDAEIVKTYDRVKTMKRCYDKSGGDQWKITQCVGDQVLNENDRYYLSCITQNRGDYKAAAVCSASKNLTPEQQIALSCAIETGGNPKAFAICTGGKLLVRELDKCLVGGIATDSGCFGPNNEFRKALQIADNQVRTALGENSEAYKAYGFWQRNVLAPGASHDVVRAINNGMRALQNGPGPNNEVVKAGQAISNAAEGAVQTVGNFISNAFGL
jgi:hypothetical protein